MFKRLPYAVVVVLSLAVAIWAPTHRSAATTSLDPEEQTFLTLINQYRQQNGLSTLSIDPNIEAASRWMSTDMGVHNYFSHTDSLGRDPFVRMCDFGYCFNTWKGENLAAGTASAQVAFDLWKGSPGHNANMLGANYYVVGIARAYTAGSGYGWYWTTDFGGYVQPSTPTPPPTATPTPLPTATPSPSPTRTPSPSPTPARTATPSPTPTSAPTATASPTPTPVPTAAATPDPSADPDGDGFSNAEEAAMGTNPNSNCGTGDFTKPGAPSTSWPADLNTTVSPKRIDIADLTTFLVPIRRLGTSVGQLGYDRRWDIEPNKGIFSADINFLDLTALVNLRPPMFDGARALNGPLCQ